MLTVLAADPGLIGQTNFDELISNAKSYLLEHGPNLAVNVFAAIVIFVIGRWVAKLAVRLLNNVFERAKLDETLAKFLSRIVYTLILMFVVMAALDRLGVNTTSFAAIVAAAGLAIGLALQGSLANFAAGIMIILFRPFKAGDFIEAGGTKGVVEEIHIFHTLMRTGDNVQIIVPNNAITGSNISNYSAKETRRIDLVVGCGYGDNLQAVKQFLCNLVDNDRRILRDPAPIVAVAELADNSVNLVVRPWVANKDYWQVRWDLTEAIKVGFDQHGFNIPFPQRDVHIHQHSPEDPQRDPKPTTAQTRQAIGDQSQVADGATGSVQAVDSWSPINVVDAHAAQDAGKIRPRRVG